jgi:hypothetical protein
MVADEFQAVSDAFRRSRLLRMVAWIAGAGRAAAPASRIGRLVSRLRIASARTRPVTRIRLAGLLLFSAVLTRDLLTTFVTPMLRPALSGMLRLDVLALSCVLVGAAPALTAAWHSSRLRRLVQG